MAQPECRLLRDRKRPTSLRDLQPVTTMKRLALFALAMMLMGCGGAGYTPKPDAELFKAIRELPGVARTDMLDSTTGFQEGTGYSGYILLEHGADTAALIDATLAILWQGRRNAGYGLIKWNQDGKGYRDTDVGLGTQKDLEERYGPQPGTGVPPTDKPALTLQR